MKDIYLLSMEVAGIKNIEKPVKLSFYKKTIDKNFDPTEYRVKSIYGGNGTGKTGLITAVDIIKRVIVDESYLSDRRNQLFLDDIINKKTKELSVEFEVLLIIEGDVYVIKYQISLKKNEIGVYEIAYEKMFRKKSNSPNKNYKLVYKVEKGELKDIPWSKYSDDFIKKTLNLLNVQSFVKNYLHFVKEKMIDDEIEPALLMGFAVFVFNTRVFLQMEDKHDAYTFNKYFELYSEKGDRNRDELSKILRNTVTHPFNINDKYIGKQQFSEYKKQIKSLEKFLKIFKSDLVSLKIDKKENKDFYITNIVLHYKDYDVYEEFESSGIRKLILMFECLNYSNKGGFVFIDEMDSNINDVYYCKLIEYFMNYGKGQLIFTTHNLDSMNLLKENKLSIDFLSSINTIYTWKKNGNFTPDNLFKNGMIKDIPFNVDSTDFIGVFEEE